jgi:cytochrome c oxidase subunit III
MSERPALDVSHLPTVVFGARAPLWWGVVGMMAIEGTMFAILAASYFYLRGGARTWPPSGVFHPGLGITTLALAVLLASAVPVRLAVRATAREDVRGLRNWLAVAVLMGFAFLGLRAAELAQLSFRWDSHAYGSVVWTATGLHTFHALAGTLENLLFVVLCTLGPVEDKHLVDARLNGMYWYFVVVSWLPFYAIFFLDPGLLALR